jgi:tRNA A37 threonylcarbamoyladenosine dehydratase
MDNIFSRVRALIGDEPLAKLADTHVVVAGYGAVGSFTAEALVRSGIGHIRIIDADRYEVTNINRQLGATTATVGRDKVAVGREHLLEINPRLDIECRAELIGAENLGCVGCAFESDQRKPDAVIDAIDTIDAKVALLAWCCANHTEVFSSMGAARKLHPEMIRSGDISQTEVCPLAREVRKRLRKLGIERGIHCVYSTERAIDQSHYASDPESGAVVRRPQLGSMITVTGSFGLWLASNCINWILSEERMP